MSRVTVTFKSGGPKKMRDGLSNRLAMAGLYLRNEHRKDLNIPYPRASVVGEFPRRRTGRLRDGVLLEAYPKKVIIRHTTYYFVYLIGMRRKMLGDTFRALKNALTQMILKG